ncbi:YggT family protein [Candidatus Saccharibacteria bacterium]|nr:YggT family protein [Candidatus Saccharibacteria bacterium]
MAKKQTSSEVPTYLNVGKVLTYAMYAYVIFAEIVLGFRVFLLAFSANDSSPFVKFIYTTSTDFLQPFRGIFPPKAVGETGYLDVSALFAIIVYGLIAWGFSALIGYINSKISEYDEQA